MSNTKQSLPKSIVPMPRKCGNCPPMIIPRNSYTPTRPSCMECCEKHIGAAMILIAELNDYPDEAVAAKQGFSRRLRAIGHLHEAEDESQQWPQLHEAIRQARKTYQADGTMPDWEALAELAHHQRISLNTADTADQAENN